ncbi:MAG: response regulator transcription factor [Opitutaceae bacterium]|jgi:DNA-binding NarL/FixJ family response regulator
MLNGTPTIPSPGGRDFVLIEDNATHQRLIGERMRRRFMPTRWRDFTYGRPGLDACLLEPPDLLLLDLHLPDMHGLDILHALRLAGLNFPVLVITASPERHLPMELCKLGVAGYIDKICPPGRLEDAVAGVLAGGVFFSASASPFQVDQPAHPSEASLRLSEREKEIVLLVTQGLSSKQIAAKTNLSPRTVENHRARILSRLGLANTADLVRWCLLNGLLATTHQDVAAHI